MTTPARDRDPGLQPERTRLAWRRTTLASTVAVLLAAKASLREGTTSGVVLGALSCAIWLGFLAVAHRRIRTLADPHADGPAALSARHGTTAALCTVALAVCAAVLVF